MGDGAVAQGEPPGMRDALARGFTLGDFGSLKKLLDLFLGQRGVVSRLRRIGQHGTPGEAWRHCNRFAGRGNERGVFWRQIFLYSSHAQDYPLATKPNPS